MASMARVPCASAPSNYKFQHKGTCVVFEKKLVNDIKVGMRQLFPSSWFGDELTEGNGRWSKEGSSVVAGRLELTDIISEVLHQENMH